MGKEVFFHGIEQFGPMEQVLKEDLHGAAGWMEVDLHIHLVAADHIVLHRMHA